MSKLISLSDHIVMTGDFERLEKKLHFSLPEDYKKFMIKQNGVEISKNYICSFPIQACSEERDILQMIYCINSDTAIKEVSIDYWINFYEDEITIFNRHIMIPIGVSAFGSPIMMTKRGGIYLADYSCSFKSTAKFKFLYRIARSFSEFTDNLTFEERHMCNN